MRILYLGLKVPAHFSQNDENLIVHSPFIKVVPKSSSDPIIIEAFEHFKHYTHLIFTSKSTVTIFANLVQSFNIKSEDIRAKTLIAIGKSTAASLNDNCLYPSMVASEETADGVIKLLDPNQLKNSYFFLPQSSRARPLISNWFSEQAIRCKTCPLYDTFSIIPSPLPDLNEFDQIFFTSPSTVDAFFQAYDQFPITISFKCIGPVTENYLFKRSNQHSILF